MQNQEQRQDDQRHNQPGPDRGAPQDSIGCHGGEMYPGVAPAAMVQVEASPSPADYCIVLREGPRSACH
jgi:hypothetical protein